MYCGGGEYPPTKEATMEIRRLDVIGIPCDRCKVSSHVVIDGCIWFCFTCAKDYIHEILRKLQVLEAESIRKG